MFPALYALDYASLKSLAEDLLADKSDGGVTKAKIFMEMLASSGTSASAMVIIDLIKAGKMSGDRDAALALTKVIPGNETIVKSTPFSFLSFFPRFLSTSGGQTSNWSRSFTNSTRRGTVQDGSPRWPSPFPSDIWSG